MFAFLLMAQLIGGAVDYCARNPTEVSCVNAHPSAAIVANESNEKILDDLAKRMYLGPVMYNSETRYRDDPAGTDQWNLASPRQYGDCEDRLIWARQWLADNHPDIVKGWRWVAILEPATRQRSNVVTLHAIAVIEADNEIYVLDTQRRDITTWKNYKNLRAITPEVGLGGNWIPYRPTNFGDD